MAFRSAGTATSGSVPSTTITPGSPAGLAANDIIILVVTGDSSTSGTTYTWPSGFTQIEHDVLTLDGQSTGIAWKRAVGGDSLTITRASASASWVARAFCWSGRDTANPPVASTAATNNSSNASPTTLTANGVTALAGDDLFWVGILDVTAGGAPTFTQPTGYTSQGATVDTVDGFCIFGAANKDNVSSGATGTIHGSLTHSGNAGWASYLIRIPVVSGGVTVNAGSIFARGAVAAPSAILGSISFAPSAKFARGNIAAPVVILGNLTLSPASRSARGAVVAPSVSLGSITLSPSARAARTAVSGASARLGSIAYTPGASSARGAVAAPTARLGSITIAPTGRFARLVATGATISGGGLFVSGGNIFARLASQAPGVKLGSLLLSPGNRSARGNVAAPSVRLGSITIAPAGRFARLVATGATISGGGPIVNAGQIFMRGASSAPVVRLGSLLISPGNRSARGNVLAPVVRYGSLSISPSARSARTNTQGATPKLGSILVSPAAALTARLVALGAEIVHGITIEAGIVDARAIASGALWLPIPLANWFLDDLPLMLDQIDGLDDDLLEMLNG